MKNKDVCLDSNGSGTIKLTHTKSGQRHASFESSTIFDDMVSKLFRIHQQRSPHGRDPNEFIFQNTRASFYDLFDEGLIWLGVAGWGFKPYSLRRGGATAFYRKHRSMELTLERGRWSTVRVGRIYINDGLAKETEMKLSDALTYTLAVKSQALSQWLAEERWCGQALQRAAKLLRICSEMLDLKGQDSGMVQLAGGTCHLRGAKNLAMPRCFAELWAFRPLHCGPFWPLYYFR